MQGRIIALDVGSKTIGVAVSDALRITAQGVEVIRRTNIKADLARVRELITQYEAVEIVVGLPRLLNNDLGPQAEKIQAFVNRLQPQIKIPVTLVDERFSTTIAQRSMIEGDVSRKKRREVVDRIAAQVILQTYLDKVGR
jgi:putative Holliday junction resolvase